MRYDLRRPCANCPFRSDIKPFLTPDRVLDLQAEIESAGKTFICHKTVDYDCVSDEGDYAGSGSDQHCAGALILLEKEFNGRSNGPGCMVNQMARLANRFGSFNPYELDIEAPVYESFEAMYDAHCKEEA